MKKFICAIMMLAVALQGCTGGTITDNATIKSAFPINNDTELKMEEHQFSLGGKSSNGYYYLTSRQDASKNINYIDYKTKKAIVLCSRLECTHSTESCSGWISHTGNSSSPLVAKEKLYIISTGANEGYYEMYKEKALSKIEVMDLNGDNRKLLCQFLPSDKLMGQVAYNDDFLYAICQKIKNEEGKMAASYYIIGVDLLTGIIEESPIDNIIAPELVGVLDNKLLIKGTNAEENLSKAGFTVFETDGKNTKSLYSWENSKAMSKVYNGKLYSVNRATSQTSEVDLKNKNERIICEKLTDKELATTGIAYFFDNKMQTILFLKSGEIIQTTVDLKDGTSNETKLIMELDYTEKKYDSYVEIVDVIEDSFLVTTDLIYNEVFIPDTNGTTIKLAEPTYKFALISKEDFFDNTPNYDDIESDIKN